MTAKRANTEAMRQLNRLLSWPLVLLFLMCSTALAAPETVPSPDVDAAGWAKALYTAFTAKAWSVVTGLVLVGITWPLRVWAAKLFPWFKTKLGGTVLNFTINLCATLGVTLAVGAKPNMASVAMAVSGAATAAGLWGWLKDYLERKSRPVTP